MGDFDEAIRQMEPECPFCDNDRDLERRGTFWFCPVCSREFPALSVNDRTLLHRLKIEPES